MSGRLRAARSGDQGFTLLEVLISMGIMSFVLAVVIAALTQIYSATTRVDTTTSDRDQLTTAFRRLDKEIRYAQWISSEGQVGTRWYIEYAMPGNSCRELKYDSGIVTLYSWTLPSSTPGNPQVLGSNLTLTSGYRPFQLVSAHTYPYATAAPGTAGVGPSFYPDHAMLRVRVNAVSGRTTVPFDALFTAENTSDNTPPINLCSAGRPTS